jgi:hypothetical protein
VWHAVRRCAIRGPNLNGAPVLCAVRGPVSVLKVNGLKVHAFFTSNITAVQAPSGKVFFFKTFFPFKISGNEFETRTCLKSTAALEYRQP